MKCRPHPYDVRVAKQIAVLTKLRLAVHITRTGIRFRRVKPWWDR